MTKPSTLEEARAARDRASALFEPLAAAVGVGIMRLEEGFGVKVNLPAPPPEDVTLPEAVDDVPARVEVVGQIRKQ